MTSARFPDTDNLGNRGETDFSYYDGSNIVVRNERIDANHWTGIYAEFDGLGRESRAATFNDQSVNAFDQVDTCYDALGRPQFVTYAYQSTGFNAQKVCANSQRPGDTFSYDALGRTVTVQHTDGNAVRTAYSGAMVTVTDEAGRTRSSVSDALGRLAEVDEAGFSKLSTFYQYDANNNLLGVNQRGYSFDAPRNRSFAYDSLSRLLVANNPESGMVCYGTLASGSCQRNGYDSNGNLLYKTDARGLTTQLGYDALNRILTRINTDAAGTVLGSDTYGWDSIKPTDCTNCKGRMSFAYHRNGAGAIQAYSGYNYDARGREILEWRSEPSEVSPWAAYKVSASYNLAGGLSSLTYPSGRHITNAYNGANRLIGVTFADFNGTTVNYPYANSIIYAATGAPTSITYGNGILNTVDYNPRLQPLKVAATGNGRTFLYKVYNWYNGTLDNGNVWSITDGLNSSRNQVFSYDSLNRISTAAQVDGSFGQTYFYDAFGNLTQSGTPIDTSGFSFNARNQLVGGGVAYDAAGNMTTTNTGQSLVYNADNQIVSVNNGAVANYTYDADGERVRKGLAGGAFTEYVNFGGHVIAEKDEAGNWSDYIFAGGTRIARSLDYDDRIRLQGMSCSQCGVQYAFFHLNNTSVLGHTVHPGDQLYAAQLQSNSRGGIVMKLKDANNAITYCQTNDEASQNIQDDTTQGVWHHRRIDLTPCAGKQVVDLALAVNGSTPAGSWLAYYDSISLVSSDGTVYSIYDHDKSVSLTIEQTSGVSQITAGVDHNPGVGYDAKNTLFYHEDNLGSSRILTSFGGWPVWQGTFSPFGQEVNAQVTTNHYKFTGKERDTESNLDYFGARFYSSSFGRWMSPDWAEKPEAVPYSDLNDPQSLNLYGYVRNNPMSRADADGHCPWCIGAGVGFAVGALIEVGIEKYKGEKLSFQKIAAAGVGGAIAGGTLGFASGAGAGLLAMSAAGAEGNVVGSMAEKAINGEDLSQVVDPKAMAKDAAWGAASGAVAGVLAKGAARAAGEKQLEAIGEKLATSKLGARHAARLAGQRAALQSSVEGAEKLAEQVGHHGVEVIQKTHEAVEQKPEPSTPPVD